MIFLLFFIVFLIVLMISFILFFYRNPERIPPPGDVILSPADGQVVDLSEKENWIRIAIFMNPLNVHVQWTPYPGKVISIEKLEGPALPGYQPKASKNKQVVTTLDTTLGKIIIKQIVGILVRRIETFVEVGEEIKLGERVGRIIFGSRVELWLPKDRVDIKVRQSQKVLAGISIMGVPK